MTAEHHPRFASAAPARQRGHGSSYEESEAASMEPNAISRDLHVVRGDASSDVSVSLSPQTEFKSAPIIFPEYLFKRTFDVAGAVFLSLLFSPLILIIVTLIRIEGEPILFRHKRIG